VVLRFRVTRYARALALSSALLGCTRAHRGDANPTSSGPDGPAPSSVPVAATGAVDAVAPGPVPDDGPFFVADPTQRVVPIRRADAPSYRYGRLDRDACEAELVRRGVTFVRGEPIEGVLAPVRLRGPVRGVAIHTAMAPKDRERSIYEVFDCRLVLALDDFADLLAKHDVVEMIHLNAYRPKSQYGCTARYWGLQHCAALAVDVRAFKRRDGSVLEVERDFHGRIGRGMCAGGGGTAGEGVGEGPIPPSAAANELWGFVCEGARRALFNVMLTPNYNAEHRNHFHLEITPEAGWMMVK
jgi:hypothetical protein